MPNPTRKSELVLVLGFLAVIAAVPVTQTCLELARHERAQFTDVFRRRPTAKSLRQFEHALEEKSWFQQKLRPAVQQLLFDTLHDTGAKAVLGHDHWLFYRPDVRYLVEPDQTDTPSADSRWIEPSAQRTRRENAEGAILRFRDQLKQRGIVLVVVPVPGKPSIYPDKVTRRESGKHEQFQSPTRKLIAALQNEGIPTVDLFETFRSARRAHLGGKTNTPLYLACDTHWTPQAARIAAHTVADRLRELKLAPDATKEFQIQLVSVTRQGDILDMMQIPGLREAFPAETVECERVVDPALGPMLPSPSDRPGTYRYPGQQALVLVLGDSFCRIYQYPEPKSLGSMPTTNTTVPKNESSRKRLLPGSAGFISHLALELKSPVDSIVSDGSASTDVRRKLSTNPEILEGKKVVIWEFVERDIALGEQGWENVPLPTKLD